MNQKTKEAIQRHGESLLLAFPNAIEKDPVALCKKLRRIENVAHQGATAYCNGETFFAGVAKFEFSSDEDAWERFAAKITKRVEAVLGPLGGHGFLVNGDARGLACKLSEEWTYGYNTTQYATAGGKPIVTDMGGFGLLAPDLNSK